MRGYVLHGRLTTIGITDSVKYAGTNSFERFEYPTRLSEDWQAELVDIAERIVAELAFDDGMLNIEFFVPEHRRAVRAADQGTTRSTYEILFELACGEDPHWRPQRPEGTAISYCRRTFRDAFVERVPEPQHGLEILVEPGLRLSDQGPERGGNDPHSYRLQSSTKPARRKRRSCAAASALARSTSGSYHAARRTAISESNTYRIAASNATGRTTTQYDKPEAGVGAYSHPRLAITHPPGRKADRRTVSAQSSPPACRC